MPCRTRSRRPHRPGASAFDGRQLRSLLAMTDVASLHG
jgi:hypothetical protein